MHALLRHLEDVGFAAAPRRGFLSQIIEFAICDTAWEADDAAVTPELTSHPIALWAMAWRARSAAWMIRHRRTLETALTRERREQLRSLAEELSAGTMIMVSFDRYLAETDRDHERRLVNQPSDRALTATKRDWRVVSRAAGTAHGALTWDETLRGITR